MENTRPYWKVIVSLTFSLTATILFVVIGWKLIRYLSPFVVGWGIAFVANPIVCWLEKKLKLVKKWGSAITIMAVIGAVLGIFYLIIAALIREVASLIENLPAMYLQLEDAIDQLAANMEGFILMLPEGVRAAGATAVGSFEASLGGWIAGISEPTVSAAGNVVRSIPNMVIGVIVAILSAYFFVSERGEVLAWIKKITPKPIHERMSMVISNFKHAVGGYFKAQFQIMIVLSMIMFAGFMLLKVRYAIVLAILFAFLDFLPFFGTAITLVPWAVYEFLMKDYKMAAVLLVLYVVTQLVRQMIQPKLVGDEVGLKPLPTLLLIYIGYKLGGFLWMILAVPVGMIIINMYKAGAFDYIVNDVKILIKGVMSLRE